MTKHILFIFILLIIVKVHADPSKKLLEVNPNTDVQVEPAKSFETKGLSLKEAFLAALDKTEPVKNAEESLLQSKETKMIAVGTFLPNLSLNGNYTLQNVPPSLASNPSISADASTIKFTLGQTLFAYGAFAALDVANAGIRVADNNRLNSRISLYSTVSTAFYNLLASHVDLQNLQDSLKLYMERVTEIKARVGIGRSQTSDLLTAQAQVASAEAAVEAAIQVVETAESSFSYATGLPVNTIIGEQQIDDQLQIGTLDEYVKKVETRPDVAALRDQVEANERNIEVVRSGYFPVLTAGGDYYALRTGVYQNSLWDANVTLTWSLFSGGTTEASLRSASSQKRQAELNLSQTRRQAVANIENFYKAAQQGLRQIRANEKLVTLSERNYRENLREYRLGLVQNIDVNTALNTLVAARRTLDQVRYQTASNIASLQANVGNIP